MGGKPGAEQRLQGAQPAKEAREELGFQHSTEEKKDNWKGTGMGGFSQERSASQDVMSLKRGDC